MNLLSFEKRCKIIELIVEGNSLRSISRIVDVSINTVTRLLVDAGRVCLHFHNEKVVGIETKRIQCDEVWGFVYGRKRNLPNELADKRGYGEMWLWVAMDPDTKLVISYYVGNRELTDATVFLSDLKSRLKSRVQLTTDGLAHYRQAVVEVFGNENIDFAQMVKLYGSDKQPDTGNQKTRGRYKGSLKTLITGDPNPDYVSTSILERQNLTVRMCNRRYTRDTNAFSKKIQNHVYALALHYMYYNFIRQHKTLRVTPAMRAGLTKRFMKFEEIVKMIDTYRNSVIEVHMYYYEELITLKRDIPLFSIPNIEVLNEIIGRLRRIIVSMGKHQQFQSVIQGMAYHTLDISKYIYRARETRFLKDKQLNYDLGAAEVIHCIGHLTNSLRGKSK